MEKLVRDMIPIIIRAQGGEPVWRVAADEEKKNLILDKLREELEEYARSDSLEELADVFQVFADICFHIGKDVNEIAQIAAQKERSRGGFKNWVVLDLDGDLQSENSDT